MPPKKTTPAKAPATKAGTKAAPAMTGATKGATGGAKGASGEAAAKGVSAGKAAEAPKPVAVDPININLREVGDLISYGGKHGPKFQYTGKWLMVIDEPGNVATFFRHRNCNYLVATREADLFPETMRLELLDAIRFGKPLVLNISDTDPEKIMALISSRLDEVQKGLLGDIYSRAILEDDAYIKIVRDSDPDEYQNELDYNFLGFMLIVISDKDPPPSIMQNYFAVKIVDKIKIE